MHFRVIVEIPKGSRNKYEMDHAKQRIRLDRMLFTATTYPSDYGFLPDTLTEDGDPLDALVLLDEPTFPGCQIEVRPVAVFWMRDEQGPDAKILCVPLHDLRRHAIQDLPDMPGHMLSEISHFFEVQGTRARQDERDPGLAGPGRRRVGGRRGLRAGRDGARMRPSDAMRAPAGDGGSSSLNHRALRWLGTTVLANVLAKAERSTARLIGTTA
jgi:inorganic pyrophosphatase